MKQETKIRIIGLAMFFISLTYLIAYIAMDYKELHFTDTKRVAPVNYDLLTVNK